MRALSTAIARTTMNGFWRRLPIGFAGSKLCGPCKKDLVRTTLWRKHTPQAVSRSEATTEFRQALNKAQEKVLLGHIGRLVTRETPPTPAIIRNIGEEIHGGKLGKHWVVQFIHRHSLHLKSMYMRNIGNL